MMYQMVSLPTSDGSQQFPHSLKAFSAATVSPRASCTNTNATARRPIAAMFSDCWCNPISLRIASVA